MMRVLLIEDNEDDACLIREALTDRNEAGFTLIWVDRLAAGLQRLTQDPMDAVLLDLSLPDSQGQVTLRKVHEYRPDAPIVVLTGLDDEALAVQSLRDGAQDYLVKGRWNSDSLMRALRYAVERTRTKNELRNSTEQLRALTGHLETVREEERTRIARELHDELGQKLSGFKMDVSWLSKRFGDPQALRDPASLLAKTRAMTALIDETIVGLRRLISELRPAVLDHLGLIAALEWQAEELHRRTGITCRFESPLQSVGLCPAGATAMFRIVQEALTNVVRHAHATEVTIRLDEEGRELRLTVKDNGKGITESETTKLSSFGILGLRERVGLLKGRMTLRGCPGQGTTLTAYIPRLQEVE
jgi:signal transduction histidine kinase